MNTVKQFSLAICLLALSAVGNADAQNPAENAAASRLIIYRPSVQNSQSALYFRVYVDGQYLGKLKNGHHYLVNLAPGDHLITANAKDRPTLSVTVRTASTAVVRTEISRRNKLNWREVSARQAIQEAPELAEYFSAKNPGRVALQAF